MLLISSHNKFKHFNYYSKIVLCAYTACTMCGTCMYRIVCYCPATKLFCGQIAAYLLMGVGVTVRYMHVLYM